MRADPLLRAVRRQLSLGRLVPLGGPADGAWLAERAAEPVLRRAVDAVPGVRWGGARLALADPDAPHPAAAVPLPPSALPPGPLRIEACFAAGADRPLPDRAGEVRAALAVAARDRLGLDVAAIDLEVTGLVTGVDRAPDGHGRDREQDRDPAPAAPGAGAVPESGREAEVAAAVLAVPGVCGLSGALGGPSRAVQVADTDDGGPLIRLQLAAGAEHRTLDVARNAARAGARAAGAFPGEARPVRVSVLVTDIRA